MQNSSEFQYIAMDTIHESVTNPRRTFDECKLGELAESIRTNGLIQPHHRTPELAGLRDCRRSQTLPCRATCRTVFASGPHRRYQRRPRRLEWQLVENSQRVDVHPYEEAQGFQRLLDMPGYGCGRAGREVRQERSPRLRPAVSATAHPGHRRGIQRRAHHPHPTRTS